jgi:hypothetical protein
VKFTDDRVGAALSQKCIVCQAKPGDPCIDTTTGRLLSQHDVFSRPVHLARLEP